MSGRKDNESTANEIDSPSYPVFSSQENIKQLTPKSDDEFLRLVKKVRKGEGAEASMSIKPCHARGSSIGSPNVVQTQYVRCFPTTKGKRSLGENCQVIQALKNVMEAEHVEVKGLSKPHLQCQKEQHVVLPTQQIKEPLLGTGVEGVNNQTENIVKRKRGRPIGSGKKRESGGSKPLDSGMFFQSKGAEAALPISSTSPPCPSENFEGLVSTSGGFPAKEGSSEGEADRGYARWNWWSREETTSLLKIRSEMDATSKRQVWEEVSRKLAQQGYNRSATKCKEKHRNVISYHKRAKEGQAGRQNGKKYLFLSQLMAHDSTIDSTDTALGTTNTPSPAPTPVAVGIGMVSSSGRSQSPPSRTAMPVTTTAVAAATQISSPDLSGGSPIGIPGFVVANNDLTIVKIDNNKKLQPTLEEHQTLSLCLEKFNPPINGDEASHNDLTLQMDRTPLLSQTVEEHQTLSLCLENYNPPINGGTDEAAKDGVKILQKDCRQLMNPTVEEHQTLSLCLEKSNPLVLEETGDNQLMSNEAITLRDTSTKSFKHSQSSNEVDSSFSLEATGNERALQSFDITTDVYSTPILQDGGSLPLENKSLPFIKSSRLWGIVESMEVFRLMPQHPHFCPLEKDNEDLREGNAIGNMLNFANLIERTRKARLEDPSSMFESKLKMLIDFEALGFNVQPIRSRLKELLRIKNRYSQLDDKSKTAEEELIHEKCQFDEMQESFTRLNMQLQALLIEKERKNFNVAELQKKADGIKERFQGARLKFDTLVAAPWK